MARKKLVAAPFLLYLIVVILLIAAMLLIFSSCAAIQEEDDVYSRKIACHHLKMLEAVDDDISLIALKLSIKKTQPVFYANVIDDLEKELTAKVVERKKILAESKNF